MLKLLLLMTITTFSFRATSDCEQLHVDRFDLAKKQFVDMDIADEYMLNRPLLLRHPYILKNLTKIIPRLKFSYLKKENLSIRKDILKKIENKLLTASKVVNLKNQKRKAYFIKENYNNDYYYSFILYVDLDCHPFNQKVKLIPKVKSVPKEIKTKSTQPSVKKEQLTIPITAVPQNPPPIVETTK